MEGLAFFILSNHSGDRSLFPCVPRAFPAIPNIFPGNTFPVVPRHFLCCYGNRFPGAGNAMGSSAGNGSIFVSRVTQTNRLWSALVISPCLHCSITLPALLPLCTFAVLPRQPPCPASGQPQLSSVEPRVIRDAPSTFAVCFVGHLLDRKLYQ